MRRAALGLRGRRGARSLHVAVVGGGVVGVSTADELLRRGCDVTLLEAAPGVAGAASATWGNAGTLWKSLRGTTPSDPATLWRTLKLLGRDPGHGKNVFIHNGCLTDAAFYRWALALARSLGTPDYDWRAAHADAQGYLLARAAALGAGGLRVAGGEVRSSAGAVLASHVEALGDSALYTQALAADCKARGLHVWTNAPAEAVDGSGVTVDGARVEADAVVLCAGSRTATLLPMYVPIHPLRGYSVTARVTDVALAPKASFFVDPEHLYCTRLDDDRMRFTCYGEFVPLSGRTPPTRALEARLKSLIEYAVPHASEWSDYVSCDVWHGDRPLTPDGLPLVGKLAPGLFINAGHGFNGWRDAGITAQRVAALVAGGEDDAPAYVAAWAPARFNL